jgi:hypothetical protein
MESSGILRHVALVRIDVSEELSACFIRVTRIGELGTTLAATSNRRTLVFLRSVRRLLVTASVVPSSPILVTLINQALSSSPTSVLRRATRRNIPKDAILHFRCVCSRCPSVYQQIWLVFWSSLLRMFAGTPCTLTEGPRGRSRGGGLAVRYQYSFV